MAASSTPPEAPATALDKRTELEKEWGKYIAAEDIFVGGVAAFRKGDAVPVSHVERKDAPVSSSQVTEKKV